jgi:hypothetical protein
VVRVFGVTPEGSGSISGYVKFYFILLLHIFMGGFFSVVNFYSFMLVSWFLINDYTDWQWMFSPYYLRGTERRVCFGFYNVAEIKSPNI